MQCTCAVLSQQQLVTCVLHAERVTLGKVISSDHTAAHACVRTAAMQQEGNTRGQAEACDACVVRVWIVTNLSVAARCVRICIALDLNSVLVWLALVVTLPTFRFFFSKSAGAFFTWVFFRFGMAPQKSHAHAHTRSTLLSL